MKFVLMIYQPAGFDPKNIPAEDYAAIAADYQAVSKAPNVSPGPPLGTPQQATTVRVKNGETVADDGPYVSVAGAVGGFVVFEAETLDEAIKLAARIPAARQGGAVEIRPCEIYW